MGGKNHQPCGKYLVHSTRLSRSLSVAYAELEIGNIALEDLILAELDGGRGTIAGILSHLNFSHQALLKARSGCTELRHRMSEEDFVGLPTLQRLDLETIGANLTAKNRVAKDAWNHIAQKMSGSGFGGVLTHFDERIDALAQKAKTLIHQIERFAGAAESGEVNRVIEENRPGNFKGAFAEIYTAWGIFNAEFLASSMLSTELWYAFMNYGSLCDREAGTIAA